MNGFGTLLNLLGAGGPFAFVAAVFALIFGGLFAKEKVKTNKLKRDAQTAQTTQAVRTAETATATTQAIQTEQMRVDAATAARAQSERDHRAETPDREHSRPLPGVKPDPKPSTPSKQTGSLYKDDGFKRRD